MKGHVVGFDNQPPVTVTTGTLLVEAASEAGFDIHQPCGGQGRCGRCVVKVTDGVVRRRSTLRLSADDVEQKYALACQTVVEGDATISILPQEEITRHLSTDRTETPVEVPAGYRYAVSQPIHRFNLTLSPPTMDDQTDDWSRLSTAARQQANISNLHASLAQLRRLGAVLRDGQWQVSAVVSANDDDSARLIDLRPGHQPDDTPLWAIAVDIGTTTVSLWLVDLISGEVKGQYADYNQQITRGEDVISRIIYSTKRQGSSELRTLVLDTIDRLIEMACKRNQLAPHDIMMAAISGNSTMIHLLLEIPAENIRLSPFITSVNSLPLMTAAEVGLAIHPAAEVDVLPGVASYVGADISAGVLSSGMNDSDELVLFIDVGTNGEAVLGNRDWLVACACSAGPAFEGGGVIDGMRATKGAIEEVWIHSDTFEPTYRVIGSTKPRGICGSGLIALMAELFVTGVIDKNGNIKLDLPTPHTRQGEHGPEYVVAWAHETVHNRDIVMTHVDIDNLMRAKAAIFAGFTVLAESVGIPFDAVERVLIGGAFGKYINIEKAVQIGLLPDKPWDKFHFLGNTSIKGSYLALIDRDIRQQIDEIASRMTYIELSSNNTFYDAFMSALFLPHTDSTLFPTVLEAR